MATQQLVGFAVCMDRKHVFTSLRGHKGVESSCKLQEGLPLRNTPLRLATVAPSVAQAWSGAWAGCHPPSGPGARDNLLGGPGPVLTLTRRAKCAKPLCEDQRQPGPPSPSHREHLALGQPAGAWRVCIIPALWSMPLG